MDVLDTKMKKTTRPTAKSSVIPSAQSRSIYDEYFEYDATYKSQYGTKTCVLLEVGSFFEIYTYKTVSTGTVQHPQTLEISRICNLSLVEKKATYKTDDQQIMMMGFRNYMLDKYLQKLVEVDYTIVVFVQEKNGKDVRRTLDAVYSRGTFIRYDEIEDGECGMSSASQMQYMICIWMEVIATTTTATRRSKKAKNIVETPAVDSSSLPSPPPQRIVYGISAVNIFTGHSAIFEYETPFLMNPTTFDEMERFVSTFSPSEMIVISNTIEKSTIHTILRFAGVQCNTIHLITKETMNPTADTNTTQSTNAGIDVGKWGGKGVGAATKVRNCEKQTYIQTILSTYYDNPNIYFQHNEFQRNTIATQSFCYLLDFIKEHNMNLIRKIAIPTFTNTSNRMVLANHTLRQLNIINDNTEGCAGHLSSVLSFTNRCGTAIGRRVFQRKLLNPTFDVEWLEMEYSKIDRLMNLYSMEDIREIRKKISCIRDIEKIFRQVVSYKIYPSAIYQLYNSINILHSVLCYFKEKGVGHSFFANTQNQNQPQTHTQIQTQTQIHTQIQTQTHTLGGIRTHREEDDGVEDGEDRDEEGESDDELPPDSDIIEFTQFLEQHLYMDICRTTNTIQVFENNIIKPSISNEVDKLLLKKEEYDDQLKAIYEYFNQLMRSSSIVKEKGTATPPNQTEYVKIHETEKSGISLQITATRGAVLKKILTARIEEVANITPTLSIPFKEIRIVTSSGSMNEIQIPLLSTLSHNILKTGEKLNIEIAKAYNAIVKTVERDWISTITKCVEYIGNIDVLVAKAYLAKEYNYCRPLIHTTNTPSTPSTPSATTLDSNSAPDKSFLRATKMRHCLIEHLQTNEIYVPNDVTLGTDGEDGILLFGTNAIGKTSLIRSIGICVVLAQAGLYVPCESFVYKPYTALFSRIIGNDNLFKNLSTFQVEISELSVILKQADCNSLILGDEICSSTEMESGLSIIMASLIEFHKRESSFIFATHFHEIVRWEEMRGLSNIRVKHLEVSFDPSSGKLIYDRKLKDGVGIVSYGLTVCRSMSLPVEFLEHAFEIRNRHYPENSGILSLSQSKYNSKKLVGICEDCEKEFSTEIHHIEPQKNADTLGVIRTAEGKTFHKNHPANLRSLCEGCHRKTHHSI
jgi:DNA mismatch repair protein MutS